ncbi:recombinase family protein [Actinomadura oligospora]|uniref:recombinase family protein n=1 Tax=Actinomadura oligospora TaxID=111804 RepID=UPI00047C907B|nr:recombinase family protein [Actinomadura oligospora]
MGRIYAYARVSTHDQNPQLQLDALEAGGYDELVSEKESGKRGGRVPNGRRCSRAPRPGTR